MATSSKKKPPASIWNEFSVPKDKKMAHDETAINVLVTFAEILEQKSVTLTNVTNIKVMFLF